MTRYDRWAAKVHMGEGCWEWTGAISASRGYSNFWDGNGYTTGHRWAYEHFVGPAGDKVVCHTCDNRKCVNPAHLFLGTPAENAADMVRKGRQSRGVQRHNAKLTEGVVRAIRAESGPHREIAARYGLTRRHVSQIVSRETWRHVA